MDCPRKICYNNFMIEKQIVAFDIGDKRIGVAVSDPFGEYAIPVETYFRTGDFNKDVEHIVRIAEDRSVGAIVCGMPVNFDGSDSVQTEKTALFVDAMRKMTKIPIELEDERFTTLQAHEILIQEGVRREKRKKNVDSIAASYILDTYLSRLRSKKN